MKEIEKLKSDMYLTLGNLGAVSHLDKVKFLDQLELLIDLKMSEAFGELGKRLSDAQS